MKKEGILFSVIPKTNKIKLKKKIVNFAGKESQ